MNQKTIDLLKNYTAFVQRVDAHIRKVEELYSDKIACKPGCDSCCRFLNLFPVEAFAISAAFLELDKKSQALAADRKKEGNCPLLIEHQCLLYGARPVICRTHGFPLYIEKEGKNMVDFCPENFKGISSLPNDALLSLEQLNTTLAAINQHFLASVGTRFPDRIPMSEALLNKAVINSVAP